MKLFLILVMVFFLDACSDVRVINTWKAGDVTLPAYKKILVLGLIRDADLELRKDMEDHLVSDLNAQGYHAISSLAMYGPKMFQELDEQKALDTIRQSGIDAVVTIVLLNKEQEREYVPARIYFTPYYYYQRRFWGYYTVMHTRIYESGYYTQNTRYFWESNLYSMDDGRKLVFSVQTKSFNPSSAATQGHQYGKLIVRTMSEKGVLPKISTGNEINP